MPPRSAKRKKPSPATAVLISEPSEFDSSLIDQNNADSEAPAKEEVPTPTTDDLTKMEVNEDVDSEERESMIAEKMELGQNEITVLEGTSCYEIGVAETLEEYIVAPILNDEIDGIGDDQGEEAEAEGNHCLLVSERNPCEEVTAAAQIDGGETYGDNNVEGRDGSGEEDPEEVMYEDDRGEEDPEEVMYEDDRGEEDPEEVMFVDDKGIEDPVKNLEQKDINDDGASVIDDKKKEKIMELFVSRLDKNIVEDDLIEVFGNFGEIKSVRVVRKKSTSRSKGFAFIRYASNEQAERAISASEGGIEVKGKQVIVSVSNDNGTTLYLGNICKSWTKERVLETLKNLMIENVEDVRVPEGPREGRTRGFAFLEFDSHPDAMSAFERLKKPDAIFGRDEVAKVSFSQTTNATTNPSEEDTSQVKTLYVEGLTDEIEAKVKEFCEQYGEVEEVRLYSRTRGKKNKDFGFVCFAARESALACLEGFKNSDGGELKVKASIAKSRLKGQSQKQVPHGGCKAENEKETPIIEEESKGEKRDASSNTNGRANSSRTKGKGKKLVKEIKMTQVVAEAGDGGNEKQAVSKNHRAQASSKPEKAKGNGTNPRMKAESRGMSNAKHGRNERTSEKSRKNQRNKSTSFGKRKRDTHAGKRPSHNADFGTYRSQYTTGHSVPVVRYEGQSYGTTSGFKRPYADMEPHAGYLEPVARKQGRDHSGQFDHPAALHYSPYAGAQYQSRGGYIRSEAETYPHTRAVYQNPPSQARYVDPVFGTHAQPHAGYFQVSNGNSSHDVTASRGGRQDLHGIVSSAYGAAPSVPSSYPPQHYTSRVGYEAGSSGGDHYTSSRVNQTERRTYY